MISSLNHAATSASVAGALPIRVFEEDYSFLEKADMYSAAIAAGDICDKLTKAKPDTAKTP